MDKLGVKCLSTLRIPIWGLRENKRAINAKRKKKKPLWWPLWNANGKWNDFGDARGAGQMCPKATREQDSPWNILLSIVWERC